MAQILFTSRSGGVSSTPYDSFNLATHVGDDASDVAKNRAILASVIGLPLNQIFFMNQVHGNRVAIVSRDSDSKFAPTADALFTVESGVALVTLVADCTPILLKSERAVAAVHVGRRGLIAGAIEATLNVFQNHGISRNEITCEIGPSICRDCYEVDVHTYKEVVSINSATATDEKRHCLDVVGGAKSLLSEAGVSYRASELCVMHSPGYFSYRRDGATGRQAGVVWL